MIGRTCIASCALFLAPAAFPQALPPGKAKPIVERACNACHPLAIGSKQRMDRDGWAALVDDMVDRGAKLTDDEVNEVVDYLATNFGPAKTAAKVNVNQADVEALATGLGLTDRESAAIVKYREANGAFKDLDGLKKVPDLDAAKIDALKERITF